MTEWEKMMSSQIYNDFDEMMFAERKRAKKLFRRYNLTTDEETAERARIMNELFKKVGENVWIEPDFHCEFGRNIILGNDVYINFGCVILDCNTVTIGDNTMLGPNIGIYATNHMLDAEERIHGGCISRPIRIGNRVWLGGGVQILPGVTIGDDSVIGAGSVVTRDIPAGVVAVGNPCRVLRKICEKDKREAGQ